MNNSLDGRRSAAIRWLKVTQNKLPLSHLKAFETCLQFSAGRLREWDEGGFPKASLRGHHQTSPGELQDMVKYIPI